MTDHRHQGVMGKLAMQLIALSRPASDTVPTSTSSTLFSSYREAEVVECFVRVKQGAGIQELQVEREHTLEDIKFYSSLCAQIGEQLRAGDLSNLEKLKESQEDRNKARKVLARIDERLRQHTDDRQLAIEELEEILCLPKVIAVRLAAPDIIVFTVKATTPYKGNVYHLGTWDIYFGDVDSLEGVIKNRGDEEHYRVKRVKRGLKKDVSVTEFHNWPDGSFCFGSNYDRIDGYARRGEFLHGMQAIILYLSTVQPGKRQQIPKMFHLDRKEDQA